LRKRSGDRRRGCGRCGCIDQRDFGSVNAACVAGAVHAAERRTTADGHEHVAQFERRDAGGVPA
jgi:hypothetical protein